MSIDAQKRRVWPWVAGGVVVLLVVGGIAFSAGQRSTPETQPEPGATQPSNAVTPQAPATQYEGRGPNGCAGGETIDANMVLTAQAEAAHDTDGAVEVAAAFTKWLVRDPRPSTVEAEQIGNDLLASNAFTDDLASYINSGVDLLPAGANDSARLTTLGGVWQIESSTPDAVTVSLGMRVIVDGAVDPSNGSSLTLETVWEDGVWKVVRGESRVNLDVLFQNGLEFDGGC